MAHNSLKVFNVSPFLAKVFYYNFETKSMKTPKTQLGKSFLLKKSNRQNQKYSQYLSLGIIGFPIRLNLYNLTYIIEKNKLYSCHRVALRQLPYLIYYKIFCSSTLCYGPLRITQWAGIFKKVQAQNNS